MFKLKFLIKQLLYGGNNIVKKVTIVGAGGKMGSRITDTLLRVGGYDIYQVANSEKSIKIVTDKGLTPYAPEEILPETDIAIYALPDRYLGKLTAEYIPLMKAGTLAILLDPAAVFAREAYIREEITTAVIHPCHPQIFFEQPNENARNDHFGGVAALQDVVIAHVAGERKLFEEEAIPLSKAMFDPVMHSFEITVEQMALLEPAATEVINTSLIQVMCETVDEVVKAGVPEEAAKSFVLGHLQMGLSIYFLKTNPLSDGAKIAAKAGYDSIIQSDWRKAMDIEFTRDVTKKMLHPEAAKL